MPWVSLFPPTPSFFPRGKKKGRRWVEGNESFGLCEASVLRCALVGVLREILPPYFAAGTWTAVEPHVST